MTEVAGNAPGVTVTQPRELRPYQTAAVAAVERDWNEGKRRVGVVLPTGSGKSTVIGKLTSNAYRQGKRVVLLAHRGELLDQMIRDLKMVDPGIPDADIGVVRADQDDHHAPVVAATLQTLANASRRKALGKRDLILWDEVHHAGAEGYHTTFEELGGYDDALMAGFTATMYRNERGVIGLGDVIEKISYEKDLRWAIKHGFLVQPRGLTVHIPGLNKLNDVRTVAGDFHQGQMAEVMEAATGYVVEAVERYAGDRRSIIFAASVDAAHHIAESINGGPGGLAALAVTGEMAYDDRKGVYDQFRCGVIDCLVTVMVLTEGADFPMCDTVVLARPTRSRNLYSQMVGRSLRLHDGKTHALVLDLSGSARTMRLVSLTDLDHGAEVADVDEHGDILDILPDDDILPGDGGDLPAIKRQGPVKLVSIDLLNNSDTLWLETPAGVPFICGVDGWVVFLWPEESQRGATKWAAGFINTRNKSGGWVDGETYLDTDDAVDLAEAFAYDHPDKFQFTDRSASWRRSQAPSEKQLALAKRMNIPGFDGMTKARLSDEISVKFASKVLDGAMAAPQ